MFTGIVEEVGEVVAMDAGRLRIAASRVLEDLREGDSICVNGACLTVVAREAGAFAVHVVPETLRRTNLGSLKPGDGVNLERALRADGRLGGHIVQGHVEATGRLEEVRPDGEALMMTFSAPREVMRYVVEKGFIAVDGVSLTVVNCDWRTFTISVIPYTRDHTVLGRRRVGDAVNLETDVVARYVERLMSAPKEPVDTGEEL